VSQADIRTQLEQLVGQSDSAASGAVRLAALERFKELGLPNRRVETWRYTDIAALGDKGFSYLAPTPDATVVERAAALLGPAESRAGAARLVFIDGHLVDSLSAAPQKAGFGVERTGPSPDGERESTALTALNTAFAPSGYRLRFAGSEAEPVELMVIGTGRGLAPQLKLGIELEPGARATVIQRFVDLPDAGEAWLNFVADVDLARGSALTLYRVQTHGPEQIQTALHRAELAEGAKLTAGNVEVGGALVRNEFQIALGGANAEADVYSLSLTRDHQHADTRIAIDHCAPNTTSHQNQRAVLADASRAVFNGKVLVRKEAQHIEARQRSDSLLLSPKAEADTKPELEIYADQVICSHGATVGELSEDHLFYLRARGIDATTARGMLTAAFADAILERIELEGVRDEARRAVSERLPRRIETA
jgi:Fe-S cluster assembly protein SufD